MSEDILTVKNLVKYFFTPDGTVRAVDGITFSIRKGETFGLVGESGSGKTTTGYTVIGIHDPTEGEILYKGKVISSKDKRRPKSLKRELQIVFQDPSSSLNPRHTIRQILSMPLQVHNLADRHEQDRIIRKLLDMVELPGDFMYRSPMSLGGGERQAVAMARALATNPNFIVMDEPTSALDVSIQAKVTSLMVDLQKELKLSYLFITHDLSLMRNVASRVAIMYLGKICEVASSSNFFENPLHPYTRMLLSSVPLVSDEEERLIKTKRIMPKGEIPSPVNIPSGCSFHTRCPEKMEVCMHVDPEMIEFEKEHFVRCHLYTNNE